MELNNIEKINICEVGDRISDGDNISELDFASYLMEEFSFHSDIISHMEKEELLSKNPDHYINSAITNVELVNGQRFNIIVKEIK